MKQWHIPTIAILVWEIAFFSAESSLRLGKRTVPLLRPRRSFLARQMPDWLIVREGSVDYGKTNLSPEELAWQRMQTTTPLPMTTTFMASTSMAFTTSLPPPAPAPAPAPGPAPAPDCGEPEPCTPIAPCNWTRDDEGVARPVQCFTAPAPSGPDELHPSKEPDLVCKMGLMFSADMSCIPPAVATCPHFEKFWNDENYNKTCPTCCTSQYGVTYDIERAQHGSMRNVTCADGAAPIDENEPMDTWGQDHYGGNRKSRISCNNGTWTNTQFYNHVTVKPQDLICASHEQIRLLQEMDFKARWTEEKLAETDNRSFPWIDLLAVTRKATLKHALEWAPKLLRLALDGKVPSVKDLQINIDAIVNNAIVWRGEPFTEQTCTDFQNHFLWEQDPTGFQVEAGGAKLGGKNYIPSQEPLPDESLVKPVGFKCIPAMQKTPLDFNYITRQQNFVYRVGCFCESQWTELCPFQMGLTPGESSHIPAQPYFKYYGFDSLDQKKVTSALGAPSNALCWYWSNNIHPEWGYMRTELGYAYQAPISNATDLMVAWNAKTAKIRNTSLLMRARIP